MGKYPGPSRRRRPHSTSVTMVATCDQHMLFRVIQRKGKKKKRPKLPRHLFDETHEAAPESPRLVAVALQRVHRHLRGVLVRHGHNVDRIIGQSCICLE